MKSFIIGVLFTLTLAACSDNHGKKVSKDYLEVYYKDGATEEQAQKTLNYFLPLWKDDGEKTKPKSIQLTKTGDTVNFRMVANMEVMGKMDENVFYTTGNELSAAIFNGAPVNVILTNDKFETIRGYSFKKIELGEKINAGLVEVYIKGGFSKDKATTLAEFLNKTINPENAISFQISMGNNGDYLLRMVALPEKASTLTDAQLQEMAAEVSKNVFNNAPVTFQLTNSVFEPIKSVEYREPSVMDTSAAKK